MTALALDACMCAGQWKLRVVMVKADMVPAGWVMADRAIGAILTAMRVLLFMTGVAICGRPFEYFVDMTGVTGGFLVLTFKLEGCQVVIELCRAPAVLTMTFRAPGTKAAFVRIILLVAGSAILGCDREIAQAAGAEMALITRDSNMFSFDPERELVVIKVFTEAIHSIVAIQAGRSIGKRMGCHKGSIPLAMAGGTDPGVKFGDVISVAILAGKRFTRRCNLVAL